jgi:uncharacterized protein DUF5906
MTDDTDPRQSVPDPWAERERREKEERKKRGNGHDPAADALGPAPPPAAPLVGAGGDINAALEELNKRYFMVNDAGRAIIFEPRYDDTQKRRLYTRIYPSDFKMLWLNSRHTVVNGKGEPEEVPIAPVWLKWGRRHQYLGGIGLYPGNNCPRDVYNLWQGFAIKAVEGDCSKWLDHLLTRVCRGNQTHFDYLVKWLARAVQHPDQPGETCVVIRGGEGAGKTILGTVMKKIFGQHFFPVASKTHLVGNFNAHLRDTIFLLGNEAFYAGDKASASVLRALITEPMIAIEAKHRDTISCPNHLHILLTANDKWVIPAAQDARRFFVLSAIDADKKRDRDYFNALFHEIDHGGAEAFLYYLMHIDLTDFEFRDVPETEGLKEQKRLTYDTHHLWWDDVLQRGYVYDSLLGLGEYFMQWREVVSTELLYKSYTTFAKARHERDPLSRQHFGNFLTAATRHKSTRSRQPLAVGEHRTDASGYSKAEPLMKPMATCYALGDLEIARSAFTMFTNGLACDWEN